MIRIIKILALAISSLLLLTNCSTTLNFKNLKYNESLELYEYPINEYNSVFPRNKINQLIDSSTIDTFYTELEKDEFKYSFVESFENDNILKFNDLKIAKYYSDINRQIRSNEFSTALKNANQLELIYPDAIKFSDLLFLKAIAFEKQDSLDKAKMYYSDFLNFSAGKFSKRFRGYRDFDQNDSIWGLERKFAKEKLNDLTIDDYSHFLSDLKPKYHYNSFKPGFLLNPEDYSRGVKWVTMLVFGLDYSNRFGLGYQVNRKIKSTLDLNLWAMASGNTTSFGAGVPIQIYKSEDDRFGIKLSPFANFAYTDSVLVENKNYKIQQGIFNFGAKLSCGYYLLPNLSLGAYYLYSFHNANNPIITKKYNIYLWWQNEYDLSLYYDIDKGISVKAGIYNGDIVGGLFLSGWELSYNITTPGLVLRIDMY